MQKDALVNFHFLQIFKSSQVFSLKINARERGTTINNEYKYFPLLGIIFATICITYTN